MRRLFFHLLKRYTRTEQNRLAILRELFNGVLRDYSEQTMPGNIHNFTIETLLANDWIRQAVHTQDRGTLQVIKNTITYAVEEGYSHIAGESNTTPQELTWQLGWQRVKEDRHK